MSYFNFSRNMKRFSQMKTIILFLFALFTACICEKAQSITPQVNENVELMSILSRMAGFPEYNMDMAGQYIKDMDNYFKDNTDHPASDVLETSMVFLSMLLCQWLYIWTTGTVLYLWLKKIFLP